MHKIQNPPCLEMRIVNCSEELTVEELKLIYGAYSTNIVSAFNFNFPSMSKNSNCCNGYLSLMHFGYTLCEAAFTT